MVKAGYLQFDYQSSDFTIVIYFFFILSDQVEALLYETIMNSNISLF
jgi:hypothetical protein